MRRLTISLLAVGLAAGACNRTETVANARESALAQPVATAGFGGSAPASADPRSEWREVTIPAGTHLPIVLDTSVSSNTSRVEEPVQAHLARAITVGGQTALPAGSRVNGIVTDAKQSGKVKGRAHLALRFESISPRGEDQRYRIETAAVGRTAPGTKKKDALEIGLPAAGGAGLGALIGGKKGALIGAAAGGGAGTAVVLSTRGKEVRLPKGAALTLRLVEPLTVKVRS